MVARGCGAITGWEAEARWEAGTAMGRAESDGSNAQVTYPNQWELSTVDPAVCDSGPL